jgi:hypothetical protein
MKLVAEYKKAFGLDEYGHIDFPVKVSNVKLSRIVHQGYSYCFPHGYDTENSTIDNRQRNWKKYRKTKYKISKA